jgi:hypothetical protein
MTTPTTEPTREPGYRGSLPPRQDRLAKPWLMIVAGIFVLIIVLSVAGVPSRFTPDPTPVPTPIATPVPSVEASAAPSLEASEEASPSAEASAAASVEPSAAESVEPSASDQ